MTDWITKDQVEVIIYNFLRSKAPQFRSKALISRQLAADVKAVLEDTSPYCEVSTASFRYWARTRFIMNEQNELCVKNTKVFSGEDNASFIGKPVGFKEDLYDILTKAHESCQHRGRDVTYEHVKRLNSLVPKQLCDMLVKACSYCNERKERLKLKRQNKEASDISTYSFERIADKLTGTITGNNFDRTWSSVAVTSPLQDDGIMREIIDLYYA